MCALKKQSHLDEPPHCLCRSMLRQFLPWHSYSFFDHSTPLSAPEEGCFCCHEALVARAVSGAHACLGCRRCVSRCEKVVVPGACRCYAAIAAVLMALPDLEKDEVRLNCAPNTRVAVL